MTSLFKPVELVNTERIELEDAQRISINYIVERIDIHVTDGDVLVLKEYLNDSDPKLFADITTGANGITISHGERKRLFSPLRGYVEAYLPRSYYGVLNVKTVSNHIRVYGRLVVGELALSTTSGRIELESVTCGTAVLSTVSGGIEAESLRALCTAHSTSGAIRIGAVAGSGEFKTVSGGIELPYHAVTGDITVGTVSGSIRLHVPATSSFTVDAHSISGSIMVPFHGEFTGGKHALRGTVGNGAQTNIRLSSVSGRMEVLPLVR